MGGTSGQDSNEILVASSSSSSSSSSSAAPPSSMSAMPSAQPWALAYRPAFAKAPANSPEEVIANMAMDDANEVVWLRAIMALTPKDLGLPDNQLLLAARFKAIMVLQAHELYDARKNWKLKFKEVYLPVVLRIMLQGFINSILDPEHVRMKMTAELVDENRNVIVNLDEDEYAKQLARKMIEHYLINPSIQFLTLLSQLFLPVDMGMSRTVIERIKEIIQNVLTSDDVNAQQERMVQIFSQSLVAELMNQSIALQGDAFNHLTLKDDMFRLSSLDVPDLCAQAGMLPREIVAFQKAHQDYCEFYHQFQDHCADTVRHAQRISPNFTDEMHSQCYKKAFDALRRNPALYVDNFMLEALLQQRRVPQAKAVLEKQFNDIFIPVADKFFQEYNQTSRSVSFYTELVRKVNPVPPSLEETVAQAHAILHTADQKLLTNTVVTQTWGTGTNTSDAAASSSNSDIVSTSAQNTQAIMATSDAPLFQPGQAIPGALTQQDVVSLAIEVQWVSKLTPLFQGLPKGPYNPDRKEALDRDDAIDVFQRQVTAAKSVEQLSALITIAEPYINRHRNPIRDYLFSIEHTNAWKACFSMARAKGLQLIDEAVKSNNPPSEATLMYHKDNNPLFERHCNNWRIAGAWRRTGAQRRFEREFIPAVKKKLDVTS